jgi:hypothetical protein
MISKNKQIVHFSLMAGSSLFALSALRIPAAVPAAQLFQLFHLWHILPGFSFFIAPQKIASFTRILLLKGFFIPIHLLSPE